LLPQNIANTALFLEAKEPGPLVEDFNDGEVIRAKIKSAIIVISCDGLLVVDLDSVCVAARSRYQLAEKACRKTQPIIVPGFILGWCF
jgi:hypothetical protein